MFGFVWSTASNDWTPKKVWNSNFRYKNYQMDTLSSPILAAEWQLWTEKDFLRKFKNTKTEGQFLTAFKTRWSEVSEQNTTLHPES